MQNISKKFVEVMKDCSHVAKNGSNDFHRYKYATAADVLEKVNASLTKHGLASVVTPNILNEQQITTTKGNVENLVTVEVVVTLIDPDSGETLTIKGLGSGQDAGDKAVGRRRLWLSNTLISTVSPLPRTTTPKPTCTPTKFHKLLLPSRIKIHRL